MRLVTLDSNTTLVHLSGGHTLHVYQYEDGDGVKLYLNDHFSLWVEGARGQLPKIIIDSDEYPTELEIKTTEYGWKPKIV